ncbi:hypothetical protein ABZ926_02480 [Streptomyces litmocidini]|uniref:LCP family protein n=1 Tax=Streptomyces litmocidini TaxID=67318 RepID=UPI0033C51638
MNGEQALDQAGEREDLPHGDFDRTHRQQNHLRTVLGKVSGSASPKDPLRLEETLDTFAETVSVDERSGDDEMRELVGNTREVGVGDMTFMNAPVKGLGTERGRSVVRLDRARCAEPWKAFEDDELGPYVDARPIDRLHPAPDRGVPPRPLPPVRRPSSPRTRTRARAVRSPAGNLLGSRALHPS